MKHNPRKGRIRAWIADAVGVIALFTITYLVYVGTP